MMFVEGASLKCNRNRRRRRMSIELCPCRHQQERCRSVQRVASARQTKETEPSILRSD